MGMTVQALEAGFQSTALAVGGGCRSLSISKELITQILLLSKGRKPRAELQLNGHSWNEIVPVQAPESSREVDTGHSWWAQLR